MWFSLFYFLILRRKPQAFPTEDTSLETPNENIAFFVLKKVKSFPKTMWVEQDEIMHSFSLWVIKAVKLVSAH